MQIQKDLYLRLIDCPKNMKEILTQSKWTPESEFKKGYTHSLFLHWVHGW